MAPTSEKIEGRIGRYRLVKRLAVGGMADLYLAQQLGPRGYERTVVVKTIRSDLVEEEELIQMLLDEARIASCLRHENIVELYEVGEEAGTQFLAMEFIFGQDLSTIRDRCAELGIEIPHEHIVTIMADVLAALHHAHHEATFQGKPLAVIHRDVSPQNVIVGFDGTAKLLDFGLAKAAAQISRTRAGVLKGKYAYMAPEQVNFKVIDQRADLFSAGVLLWELLTQERLFYRSSDYETVKAVMACEVPFPRSVRHVPWGLSWVAYRALRREPRWRYASASQMRSAVLRCTSKSRRDANEALAEWMSEVFAPRLHTRDVALTRTRAQNPGRLREVLDAGFELISEVSDPSIQAHALSVGPTPAGAVASLARASRSMPATAAGVMAALVGTWRWFVFFALSLVFLGVSLGIYISSRTPSQGDHGYLTVRSATNGVEVTIGEKSLGIAPVIRIPIAAGRYRVVGRAANPNRSTAVEVAVEAGQEQAVELNLAPDLGKGG